MAASAVTFLISSAESNFLIVTEPGGFEEFLREMSQPALTTTPPPSPTEPPDIARVIATAATYGIEIGPPGVPQ